ncbi:MAG: hypothetical protein CSA96_06560 [Bacteroidetes bacterium]|nr:MAG: hypothetical protein CSA96_06560 [Bacteroidota bacterium]
MTSAIKRIPFHDYEVARINLKTYKHQPGQKLINTINAYSYVVAEEDEEFKKALQASDLLLPDGFPIVWAVKRFCNEQIFKIAGADIHQYLLEKANKEALKVFYLGSMPSTLEAIGERIGRVYPNVTFSCFSPPYKPVFSDEDNRQMLDAVNAFKPDILFVGMTAPKQEIWSYRHKDSLDTGVICSIGAVFDFYAGTVKRAPAWMIKLRLEWFFRLVKEPKRMWRRYLVYSPRFFRYVLQKK